MSNVEAKVPNHRSYLRSAANSWVAICLSVGLWSCGYNYDKSLKTRAEAMKAIPEFARQTWFVAHRATQSDSQFPRFKANFKAASQPAEATHINLDPGPVTLQVGDELHLGIREMGSDFSSCSHWSKVAEVDQVGGYFSEFTESNSTLGLPSITLDPRSEYVLCLAMIRPDPLVGEEGTLLIRIDNVAPLGVDGRTPTAHVPEVSDQGHHPSLPLGLTSRSPETHLKGGCSFSDGLPPAAGDYAQLYYSGFKVGDPFDLEGIPLTSLDGTIPHAKVSIPINTLSFPELALPLILRCVTRSGLTSETHLATAFDFSAPVLGTPSGQLSIQRGETASVNLTYADGMGLSSNAPTLAFHSVTVSTPSMTARVSSLKSFAGSLKGQGGDSSESFTLPASTLVVSTPFCTGSELSRSCTWNLSLAPWSEFIAGIYTFRITAHDRAGNPAHRYVSITLDPKEAF